MLFLRRLLHQQQQHHPTVIWRQVVEARRCQNLVGLPIGSCGNVARLSSTSYKAAEDNSSGLFSWVDKIKGVFTGKASDPASQTPQQPSSAQSQFTLLNCADEMKKARLLGSLAQFGRGLPRGGEATITHALERQETILRALASHDPTGQHLDAKQKAEVATQCSCTVQDVDKALGKFEWTKEAYTKILQLQEKGKPLPKTWEEVEKVMGGPFKPDASRSLGKSGEISRNAPCQCGSGKKYKRCCGRT